MEKPPQISFAIQSKYLCPFKMTSEDFKTQTINSTFTFFLNYIQDQIFENNTNGREKKSRISSTEMAM